MKYNKKSDFSFCLDWDTWSLFSSGIRAFLNSFVVEIIKKMKDFKPYIYQSITYFLNILAPKMYMERVTGLEPATVCLEGRNSSQLSYTRILSSDLRLRIFVV